MRTAQASQQAPIARHQAGLPRPAATRPAGACCAIDMKGSHNPQDRCRQSLVAASGCFERDQWDYGQRGRGSVWARHESPLGTPQGQPMSTYRLDKLFAPRSVAVVGGSPRATSPGRAVLREPEGRRLRAGRSHLVNPRYAEIEGIRTVKSLTDVAGRRPISWSSRRRRPTVPAIVAAGRRKAARRRHHHHGRARPWRRARSPKPREKAARADRPAAGRPQLPRRDGAAARSSMPASPRSMPQPGDLALISQSGAIAAGLVEWAATRARRLLRDRLARRQDRCRFRRPARLFRARPPHARDPALCRIRSQDARKFMSAARAAARIKPVVVVKSGRHAQGAKAAQTHTGALAGSDAVYDAAFRRAGLLRVLDLDELFAAAETLGRLQAVLRQAARDPDQWRRHRRAGGRPARRSRRHARRAFAGDDAARSTPRCRRSGRAPIRSTSPATPMPARYARRCETLLDDPDNDAILVMNVPTALASAADAAQVGRRGHAGSIGSAIVPAEARLRASGSAQRPAACAAFDAAGIPQLRDRVRRGARLHASRALPRSDRCLDGDAAEPAGRISRPTSRQRARSSDGALRGGTRLARSGRDRAQLLAAYAIPITPAMLARDADAAVAAAAPFLAKGQTVVRQDPVARHRAQVGRRRRAAQPHRCGARCARRRADILARAQALRPDARIAGVTIHPMIVRPEGARADRRHRRRSDLRSGDRVRPGRHRGRGRSTTRRWRCRRSISSSRAT